MKVIVGYKYLNKNIKKLNIQLKKLKKFILKNINLLYV